MYDAYYPLDEKSYREALPRCGLLRFNQSNLFNNQIENRMKRHFVGGLDRRDGVCCMYASLTLPAPPENSEDAASRLFFFMDIFASCLSVQPVPVTLDWYQPE